MKTVTILVALAAFAAVAANAGGLDFPVHGGYNCGGAITEIRCLEDDNGLVEGISFYNEDLGGWNNFCGSDDDATADDPPGDSWVVPDGESIIRVDACRGGKYGYVNVTFYTDKGSEFTCGSGTGEYAPGGYDSDKYTSYDYTKDGKAGNSAATTTTTPGTRDNYHYTIGYTGKRLQGFGGGSHGWGWDSWCQSYQSPRQPTWVRAKGAVNAAGAPSGSGKVPWWQSGSNYDEKWHASNKTAYNRFWGPGFYYFVANWSATPPDNGHGFKGGAGWTYVTYTPKRGGTPVRYYKTWSAWQQARKAYNKNPRAYDYKPAYYYREVFPLASFKAFCDANNYVYNLFAWCFNSKLKA